MVSRYSHLLSDKKRRNKTTRQKKYAARFPHQSVVGALKFLTVHPRPDLFYTINLLSRFNSRLTYGACQAALHTLGYLSNTLNQGIVFPNVTEGEPLTVYSDADWAGDMDTSGSTTGYIVYLWSAPIV